MCAIRKSILESLDIVFTATLRAINHGVEHLNSRDVIEYLHELESQIHIVHDQVKRKLAGEQGVPQEEIFNGLDQLAALLNSDRIKAADIPHIGLMYRLLGMGFT